MTAGWLARSVLLAAWALVAWGGLLLLVALGEAADEGLAPAFARLVPARETSVWGWLNSLSAGLALAVGVVAAGLFLRRGVSRPSSEPERPGN